MLSRDGLADELDRSIYSTVKYIISEQNTVLGLGGDEEIIKMVSLTLYVTSNGPHKSRNY